MSILHIRQFLIFIVILTILCFLLGCSSTKATLKFESLKYPVSMSAFLYDQNDQVIMKDEQLESVHSFEFKKTFWSIGYGIIPLSSEGAICDSLNSLVKMYNGDGILNFSIAIDQGIINKIYSCFMFVPSLIPVFPSSADITISGEIVKLLPSKNSSYYNEENGSFTSKTDIAEFIKGAFNGLY